MATNDRDLEIHLKNGICKVIEGPARRTYFSTEEAVGLALLKFNPDNVQVNLSWQDFLSTKGVAFAAQGNKSILLMTTPGKERTIGVGRDSRTTMTVMMPPILFALKLQGRILVKSLIYVIKAGVEGTLRVTQTDATLCPFPYGNVYTHGGVCWGSTNTRNITSPSEVEDLFFGSTFNGDLCYLSATGVAEHSLIDLHRRVGKALPVPTSGHYNKSVAQVAQDIVR